MPVACLRYTFPYRNVSTQKLPPHIAIPGRLRSGEGQPLRSGERTSPEPWGNDSGVVSVSGRLLPLRGGALDGALLRTGDQAGVHPAVGQVRDRGDEAAVVAGAG